MKHPRTALCINGRLGRGDCGKELEADDSYESPENVLRNTLDVGYFAIWFQLLEFSSYMFKLDRKMFLVRIPDMSKLKKCQCLLHCQEKIH